MEEELKAAKEACTDRVGEVGIGRQIAGNVRDLIITRFPVSRQLRKRSLYAQNSKSIAMTSVLLQQQ
jgi:hypothetical protein